MVQEGSTGAKVDFTPCLGQQVHMFQVNFWFLIESIRCMSGGKVCLFGWFVNCVCVSMCLPGGKAYQRDPVEECDSSRRNGIMRRLGKWVTAHCTVHYTASGKSMYKNTIQRNGIMRWQWKRVNVHCTNTFQWKSMLQVHLVGVSEHCTHSSGRECALYTVPEQGVVK